MSHKDSSVFFFLQIYIFFSTHLVASSVRTLQVYQCQIASQLTCNVRGESFNFILAKELKLRLARVIRINPFRYCPEFNDISFRSTWSSSRQAASLTSGKRLQTKASFPNGNFLLSHFTFFLLAWNYTTLVLFMFLIVRHGQKPESLTASGNRVRPRLCTTCAHCRAVKHIEVWLERAGQLLWHKDGSCCQRHRCRVMSHSVLEFCQEPASVLLTVCPNLSLRLSASPSCTSSLPPLLRRIESHSNKALISRQTKKSLYWCCFADVALI